MPPESFVTLSRATPPPRGLSASDRRFWLAVWGAVFGCLGALDIYRMTRHDGSTLSETIRYVLHTDTPTGKTLFLGGVAVFVVHILSNKP